MLLLRGGGIRVTSFLRFSATTRSLHPKFYSTLWPLLCASNSREAKKTSTNFNALEKKQYFCSSTSDDMTMETAKLAEPEPGTGTALDDERPQEQKNDCSGSIQLAKKFMRSMADGGEHRNFTVELCQGRSGIKFFEFSNLINGRFFNSPNFLVPGEAYQFVRAMDELLRVLATKEGVKLPRSSDSERRVLFSTGLSGVSYDFKLDLQWMDGQFTIKLSTCRTEAKPDHREKLFMLNVKQLHWIRHEMGRMLVEFDGSQSVDEPPKFPEWLSIHGRPRHPIQYQMPVQTYQNNRLQQQMPMGTMPMMELAQEGRSNHSNLPAEHFGKRFNTGNMDKNAMACGENVVEDGHKSLAKMQLSSFGVGEVPEQLEIVLEQDQADGAKFVEFRKEIDQEQIKHFRKIRVPLEVYPFARAMDLLLGKLAMEEGGQKLPSTGSRVLFSTSSPGMANDFKLDLMLVDGHFVVKFGNCQPGHEHKEMKPFWLSVKEFHWFRQSMGDILAKFDGSQQLDLPPKLPDWLLLDDRPIPHSGQYLNPVSKPSRNVSAERYPSQYRKHNYQSRVPQPYNNFNREPLAQQRQQPRTWPRQAETADNYRQQQQPAMTWEFGGGGQVHGTKGQCEHGPSGQDKLDDAVQGDEK